MYLLMGCIICLVGWISMGTIVCVCSSETGRRGGGLMSTPFLQNNDLKGIVGICVWNQETVSAA